MASAFEEIEGPTVMMYPYCVKCRHPVTFKTVQYGHTAECACKRQFVTFEVYDEMWTYSFVEKTIFLNPQLMGAERYAQAVQDDLREGIKKFCEEEFPNQGKWDVGDVLDKLERMAVVEKL